MTGLLGKLFGKGKKQTQSIDDLVEDVLMGILDYGKFQLSYEIGFDDEEKTVEIELFGEDEELLKDRDGQLLDSIQLFVTRVVQHQMPDDKFNVMVDCDGYRQEANKALLKLADKLKSIALKKEKSVYFRALPPKDRKVIHQYLAEDNRVKSHSVGDGLYKKIKIYPASLKSNNSEKSSRSEKSTQ